MALLYFVVLAFLTATACLLARNRAAEADRAGATLHSRPTYHGALAAIAVLVPMLAVFCIWSPIAPAVIESRALAALGPELVPQNALQQASRLRDIALAVQNPAAHASEQIRRAGEVHASLSRLSDLARLGFGIAAGLTGAWWAHRRFHPAQRARNQFEGAVRYALIGCSAVAVLTTAGIVFSVLFETLRFFNRYPPLDFLFGLHWSPQTAIRADQVGQSGSFGFVPLFGGTMLIMAIAMLVAGPIGLLSAVYMAEYATARTRSLVKPVLEILAGVPTVVFGFFAAITVAPLIRELGQAVGLDVASESALAAGFVMGVMIIPFVSSLSDDVINAVPQSLRDGSYAMGATRSETIKRVVLPAALPGIVSAFMLAISRAVGETMIVVMAAGLAANLTFNPLEAVTTITVQIKTLLTGDQEFDSAKTLSAFALGFVLFFFTLALNVIALQIVRRYREQYD
jgi:phosphate transport system permease protein